MRKEEAVRLDQDGGNAARTAPALCPGMDAPIGNGAFSTALAPFRLFVGKLSRYTTTNTLRAYLESFLRSNGFSLERHKIITDLYLPSDARGLPRGFAFVSFSPHAKEELRCVLSYENHILCGRRIVLDLAAKRGMKLDDIFGPAPAAGSSGPGPGAIDASVPEGEKEGPSTIRHGEMVSSSAAAVAYSESVPEAATGETPRLVSSTAAAATTGRRETEGTGELDAGSVQNFSNAGTAGNFGRSRASSRRSSLSGGAAGGAGAGKQPFYFREKLEKALLQHAGSAETHRTWQTSAGAESPDGSLGSATPTELDSSRGHKSGYASLTPVDFTAENPDANLSRVEEDVASVHGQSQGPLHTVQDSLLDEILTLSARSLQQPASGQSSRGDNGRYGGNKFQCNGMNNSRGLRSAEPALRQPFQASTAPGQTVHMSSFYPQGLSMGLNGTLFMGSARQHPSLSSSPIQLHLPGSEVVYCLTPQGLVSFSVPVGSYTPREDENSGNGSDGVGGILPQMSASAAAWTPGRAVSSEAPAITGESGKAAPGPAGAASMPTPERAQGLSSSQAARTDKRATNDGRHPSYTGGSGQSTSFVTPQLTSPYPGLQLDREAGAYGNAPYHHHQHQQDARASADAGGQSNGFMNSAAMRTGWYQPPMLPSVRQMPNSSLPNTISSQRGFLGQFVPADHGFGSDPGTSSVASLNGTSGTVPFMGLSTPESGAMRVHSSGCNSVGGMSSVGGFSSMQNVPMALPVSPRFAQQQPQQQFPVPPGGGYAFHPAGGSSLPMTFGSANGMYSFHPQHQQPQFPFPMSSPMGQSLAESTSRLLDGGSTDALPGRWGGPNAATQNYDHQAAQGRMANRMDLGQAQLPRQGQATYFAQSMQQPESAQMPQGASVYNGQQASVANSGATGSFHPHAGSDTDSNMQSKQEPASVTGQHGSDASTIAATAAGDSVAPIMAATAPVNADGAVVPTQGMNVPAAGLGSRISHRLRVETDGQDPAATLMTQLPGPQGTEVGSATQGSSVPYVALQLQTYQEQIMQQQQASQTVLLASRDAPGMGPLQSPLNFSAPGTPSTQYYISAALRTPMYASTPYSIPFSPSQNPAMGFYFHAHTPA